MLEHPECIVLSRQLSETLNQRTVIDAIAAKSPHRFAFYLGDPANYPGLIVGKTCNNARAFGGMVEWSVGDMTVSLFDGMNIRYLPKGKPIPDKHQGGFFPLSKRFSWTTGRTRAASSDF